MLPEEFFPEADRVSYPLSNFFESRDDAIIRQIREFALRSDTRGLECFLREEELIKDCEFVSWTGIEYPEREELVDYGYPVIYVNQGLY
ncbi:hypothetical protein GTO91_16880 [Heliobacterium undosum]|uniref:Uncharacterized protein n=1 Tax=Heliomicrobium undosum TaxID=121734 RepID=A0A845L6Q2_9FIRM|nr:hypothetical protein [Heliomicrobium undosum]MZP31376.1 hypothetical protein [Heliomicrobium undosum]